MNLAKLMQQRGLNQVELAERSGLSQPMISNYLIGSHRGKQPTLRNLLALVKALNCSLEDLTGIPVSSTIDPAKQPSPEMLELARTIESLPVDDWRRKSILEILKHAAEGDKGKSEPDVTPEK